MAIEGGVEALHRLKSIDPPLWLTPSPDLSQTARKASQYLFSSLKPFCPKPMFDTLLIHGFDAEQIWQQIDLQTQPLIANLRRDVKRFERNPEEISKLFGGEVMKKSKEKIKDEGLGEESESDDEAFDDEENVENGDEDEEDEDEEEEEEEEENGSNRGIEDRFLKINELEEYLEKDEAREYGDADKKDEDSDEDDEEDDDDEIGGFEDDSDGGGSAGNSRLDRYEDFFGGKKKKVSQKESKPLYESDDEEQDDEEQEDDDDRENGDEQENDDGQEDDETNGSLSTHEKQLKKLRSKIEQMEKENLEKSSWTMQGEVTAGKRPKNSALEVDLDFERNARPMPVITEEVTASLEELIKKRILEEHFDDVEKAPSLPTKAPKEIKELDENKSKKGLGEIYEEEFVEQTGLGTGPVSSRDELKKEAQLLFDKLCLKLDALSHFHFKPKPVIEDMSIQTNVPALAMEEIAPVAVSDAAMLAPEEVFAGKGDIKEEAELTQAERKRRRANKKRKFKAEESKRVVKKKVQDKTPIDNINGKEA